MLSDNTAKKMKKWLPSFAVSGAEGKDEHVI